MKIGIIAAMDEEIKALVERLDITHNVDALLGEVISATHSNHELFICKSGIGKTNAALATMQLKTEFEVEYIINIGSAGGLEPTMKVFDVVIANAVSYHDVDVTAFGYELGQLPQMSATFAPDLARLSNIENVFKNLEINYYQGLIISGDQFIQNNQLLEKIKTSFVSAMCVEMEAAAIAHTCSVLKIPFQIIRAISDVPSNDSNHIDFKQFLESAACNSAKACLAFIEEFSDVNS